MCNCFYFFVMEVLFKYDLQLWLISSGSWVGPGTNHTVLHKNQENMFYISVPNYFSLLLGLKSAGRSAQTLEKWSILDIFILLPRFLGRFRRGWYCMK